MSAHVVRIRSHLDKPEGRRRRIDTRAQAVAAIARMTAHDRHVFWADDLPVASPHFPAAALQGHQQITDAYLLALCASRGAHLATFDTAIAELAADPKLVTAVPPP
jgi:predicted nucleic acid-binding protein